MEQKTGDTGSVAPTLRRKCPISPCVELYRRNTISETLSGAGRLRQKMVQSARAKEAQ